MENTNSKSTEISINKKREVIKRLFTRKTIVVNNRLLTISDEDFLKEYDELYAKKKAIQYLTKDFNPDTDVIVPKAKIVELTLNADSVNSFCSIQKDMAKQIEALHSIQTGKLYQPKERKPSKKEQENAEVERMRIDAHIRALNK